ncbi:hypothetical protein ACWEFL_34465 [Streptomyces sp. NPDC004838]
MHGPGPGYAPQQSGPPSTAAIVVLRVLFLALSLLSCGLLGWVTMLRVAFIRRRQFDWIMFVTSFFLMIAMLVVISVWGSEPEDSLNPGDVVALLGLFILSVGSAVHYLVIDVRNCDERRAAWSGQVAGYPANAQMPSGFGPPPATPGYGYPPQAARQTPPPGYGYPPRNAHTPPHTPQPQPQAQPQPQPQPHAQTPPPRTPPHTPPPARPPHTPAHTPPPQAPAQPQAPQAPAQPNSSDKPRIDQVRAELDELSDYLRKEQGR